MFREMRRSKQQLPEVECIEILKSQPRGILSMVGDDGYPYGIPLSHWYCEADGKIYFHGAKEGHKVDAIKRCDKVSFCVCDQGYREADEWALNIRSVIVFGRIRVVEDSERAMHICRGLSYKFTSDTERIEEDIRYAGPKVLCLELTPEHITGKKVKES